MCSRRWQCGRLTRNNAEVVSACMCVNHKMQQRSYSYSSLIVLEFASRNAHNHAMKPRNTGVRPPSRSVAFSRLVIPCSPFTKEVLGEWSQSTLSEPVGWELCAPTCAITRMRSWPTGMASTERRKCIDQLLARCCAPFAPPRAWEQAGPPPQFAKSPRPKLRPSPNRAAPVACV